MEFLGWFLVKFSKPHPWSSIAIFIFLYLSQPKMFRAILSQGKASAATRSACRSYSSKKAGDIGVLAMETYFPKHYVAQEDLEKFDGIPEGKYTKGLGQLGMSFCDDREDMNSIALTAVHNLLDNYNIDPKSIGRLEVGTETILDKSKSVKSTLMNLFDKHGNTDIEGIDTTNACYGGTSALFNALQWVESSYWDGRNAIVVAGDIAVYDKGVARPTGGAGVVAMLIGPNAPVVFEQGLRGTYMEHAWDFYKPNLSSEYPTVDGKLSNDCYIRALDNCFEKYRQSFERLHGRQFTLDDFDYCAFHSPYSKLVQKSWARMYYLDYLNRNGSGAYSGSALSEFRDIPRHETYNHRDVFKVAQNETADSYNKKVLPTLTIPRNIGNSYCGSLYAGLNSLLVSEENLLDGKRVGMFSYGSGLAASLFSVIVNTNGETFRNSRPLERLSERTKATPEVFSQALQLREDTHTISPYNPVGVQTYFPGTYYLTGIDDQFRRTYERSD